MTDVSEWRVFVSPERNEFFIKARAMGVVGIIASYLFAIIYDPVARFISRCLSVRCLSRSRQGVCRIFFVYNENFSGGRGES